MGLEFHIGSTVWEELREEFERVLGGDEAVLVLGVSIVSGENAMARHGIKGSGKSFTEEAKRLAEEIEREFDAEAHLHLHPDSGVLTFFLRVGSGNVVDVFQGVVDAVNGCEACLLSGVEGELRVGEELAALVFGSSAKVLFILPGEDGRRLKALEALLTV
ncbi:hypothetical protein B6U84_05905 [Candidatus Bathyarchaeota archaeon ex4484_40]|nr:MAG: hypothetical protein B6U84_05905 [Candidatus Bathyarchaeota archaeon ex4484_40]